MKEIATVDTDEDNKHRAPEEDTVVTHIHINISKATEHKTKFRYNSNV
jgi:hypothetical protein